MNNWADDVVEVGDDDSAQLLPAAGEDKASAACSVPLNLQRGGAGAGDDWKPAPRRRNKKRGGDGGRRWSKKEWVKVPCTENHPECEGSDVCVIAIRAKIPCRYGADECPFGDLCMFSHTQ